MLRTFRIRGVWSMCQTTRSYTQKTSNETEASMESIKKKMEKIPRIKPLGQPPKVWEQIEKKTKDGKSLKFTIQEIPEDRHEDALQHMCTYFLAEEPTCKCHNSKNDPAFVKDMSTVWRMIFAEGIAVAAFTDNPDGGKPIIAGMNALGISFKDHDILADFPFTSQNCKNTFDIMSDATKLAYDHYKTDKYLAAIGLSVAPKYRGYGLGTHILKIREHVGREYKIPATVTVFTSIFSQNNAAKAGFEELTERKFVDLVDKNGKEYFPGIESKTFKIMGRKLP
ncbi:hypothetical protein DMN91_008313 [Ooceraea biroi]|uniref:N-acetyltransferase domain-containing protein n=1 Tax=Ooceraea biroi TaxID=2015173 RepID=A0A026VXK3_OOCBI|nr:uncharacterized protein LOC105285830 [Ooceraea biroi]EZA48171.1 hypothetical protein X777_14056 [Ooceraea biroi]RLU19756.1 hypothetical protein DMN91_008313 [Ooceraea biroi]